MLHKIPCDTIAYMRYALDMQSRCYLLSAPCQLTNYFIQQIVKVQLVILPIYYFSLIFHELLQFQRPFMK